MNWSTLPSTEDASVNHVLPTEDGGHLESRLVQRTGDYFICYLSSHTGCAHSCRFCHLTATRQTMMAPVDLPAYVEQAKQVLATYRSRVEAGQKQAWRMHFNFMSRGEALSNPHFVNRSAVLFSMLGDLALEQQLMSRYLVSTIMPVDFTGKLHRVLAHPDSVLYYSLYSVNPTFRRRWLPKAMHPAQALQQIREYQDRTKRRIVLHWALIAGQNDSMEDVDATLDAVERAGIRAKFNLVRYNPHDQRHGLESSEEHLQKVFTHIAARLNQPGSRIVPRVGRDVFASCGMFINPRETHAEQ